MSHLLGHVIYHSFVSKKTDAYIETGSIHITGSKYKALPIRLTLSWFSFVENRFYSGDFELPYDKILQLFKNGFTSPVTGEKSTYEWIVVGIGPEGAVSIWVAGQKLVLEVASYKGGEVDIPWTAVSKSEAVSRADYIEGVLQHRLPAEELKELKEKGIPPGISDVYRKQYRWNLSISGQGTPTAWVDTSNGESEYVDLSQTNKSRTSRALPEVINVCWENKRGTKYTADIIFDERETLAAYRKLAALNDDHPMQLQLEITDVPRVIHASLSDGRYIIKLHKTEVKTFTRR